MKRETLGHEFQKSPLRQQARKEIRQALEEHQKDVEATAAELANYMAHFEEDDGFYFMDEYSPIRPVALDRQVPPGVEDDFALASSVRHGLQLGLLCDEY